MWKQLNWKNFFLLICKCLRLFLNTLTADDKYCLLDNNNLRQPIEMQLSQKQKTFSELVSAVLKARIDFENFQKEDAPNSWCSSEIIDSRKRGKRNVQKVPYHRPFEEQHGKRDQTLLKSKPHHFYHIYCSLWRQLSWRKSLLVICKFLTMFVNILTADDKYSLLNRNNLR